MYRLSQIKDPPRQQPRFWILFALGWWLSLCSWQAGAANPLLIRDSQNGRAIAATITEWVVPAARMNDSLRRALKRGLPPEKALAGQKNIAIQQIRVKQGRSDWRASNQWRVWQVNSPGHAPLQLLIEPGAVVPVKAIWLDPLPGKTTAGCARGEVCGFVTDSQSAQPLAGARVQLRAGQKLWQTRSDDQGFFALQPGKQPGLTDIANVLEISFPGYRQQQWQALDWHSGIHFLVDLKSGSGVEKHSLENPLAGVPSGQVPLPWLQAKLSQLPNPVPSTGPDDSFGNAADKQAPAAPAERPGGAVFMDPPDSISVGFAANGGYCCGNSCASSQVFSLETYVQKGLDNEWISSWGENSLKAGSVPFRSYGAWHAIESPYNGYDICAGPCCQAFGLTSYGSTVAAAQATAGILLELNGALARSEYSAENNAWNDPNDGLTCTNSDLSCGDGFVGSPASGWPCLADDSAGRGCFGHGRGMSQWGTYYHDLNGENWATIVDHYYNASGSPAGQRSQYPTTPVALLSFAPWPKTLNAGDAFDLALVVNNATGSASSPTDFGPVLIGASLLAGSADYSDPANDASLTLTSFGQQNLGRPFQTQNTWPPGSYDLAVALWLDTDGNGQITGEDWVLAFEVQPDAITLLAPDDLIFADGF